MEFNSLETMPASPVSDRVRALWAPAIPLEQSTDDVVPQGNVTDKVARLSSMVKLLDSLGKIRLDSEATAAVFYEPTRTPTVNFAYGDEHPRCSATVASRCLHLPVNKFCKLRQALFHSCSHGDIARFDRALRVYLQSLLKQNASHPRNDLNFEDVSYNLVNSKFHGDTMMGIAASKGHLNIVEALLQVGANPLIENEAGLTPMQLALSHSQFEVFELLLLLDSRPEFDHKILMNASALGRADYVSALLAVNPGYASLINEQDPEGKSALWVAAFHGKIEVAKVLIDNSAEVDSLSSLGTALTVAAGRGDLEMIKLLLEAGADMHLALLSIHSDGNLNPEMQCSQKRVGEVIKQCWKDCFPEKKFQILRLRRIFINQHRKLVQHETTTQLIIESELSESIRNQQNVWSVGVRTLNNLLDGTLPMLVTEILSTLLVALSMAFLMDENTFCLDDGSSHVNSIVGEIPEWICLISSNGAREACDNLAADIWGSDRGLSSGFDSTDPVSADVFPSISDIQEFLDPDLALPDSSLPDPSYSADGWIGQYFDLDRYIGHLTTEKQLAHSIQTNGGGAFQKSRQTVQNFSLFQEDPFICLFSQDIPGNMAHDKGDPSFYSGHLDMTTNNPTQELPLKPPCQTSSSNRALPNDTPDSDSSCLVSGVVCVIFLLFLVLLFTTLPFENSRRWNWSAKYQALCQPTLKAAADHMLLDMPNNPVKISYGLLTDNDALIFKLNDLLARRHIWNLAVLCSSLEELGISEAACRHARSFCGRWNKPYLADLKQHAVRILQGDCHYKRTVKSPELDQEDIFSLASSLDLDSGLSAASTAPLFDTPRPTPSSAASEQEMDVELQSSSPSSSVSKFRSLYCQEHGKQFTTVTNYNRHLRDKHAAEGAKRWTCSKCGKKFTRKAYRDKHEEQSKWHRFF